MKEFMKKVLPDFCAGMAGLIIGGILGSLLNESIGYTFVFAYLYGMFGHSFINELVGKKVK